MLPYQSISRKEDGIAIVGLGGAGANILQCFGGSSADNVRLCIMSLDERVGRACGNVEFIQLGSGLNRGLGSGGDPEVAVRAAQESREQIATLLADARLLVMVAGLGGGTGSGTAPLLAQMAREAGLFLVSVLVMPFAFEGQRRREQAERALEEVAALSDIVFCFENDYMEDLFRNRAGARAVFEEVDRLLAKATASVPTLANSPGLINLGLDELAAALENNDSRCLFGSGSGYGPHRAEDAARAALESPLVSYHNALRFARTVIVHIAGGDTMSLTEIRRAMETVREALADEDVRIFFGTTVKPKLGDEMRITLIASVNGAEFKLALAAEEEEEAAPAPAAEEPAAPEPVEEEEEEVYTPEPEAAPEEEVLPQEEETLYPDEELPRQVRFEPIPPADPEPYTQEYTVEYEKEEEMTVEPELPEPAPQPQEEEEEFPFTRHGFFPRREVQQPLFQGELTGMMEEPPAAPRHHSSSLPPTAKTIFPEDLPESSVSTEEVSRYAPENVRRLRPGAPADDLDTPPSLRSFNDLRDMF